ncbi:hypothetical protein QBC39DRAFT_430389 [Podospora conica]|nr:hypothetical protein QBC39DRAFT_430389 [Schizothecium conicum]
MPLVTPWMNALLECLEDQTHLDSILVRVTLATHLRSEDSFIPRYTTAQLRTEDSFIPRYTTAGDLVVDEEMSIIRHTVAYDSRNPTIITYSPDVKGVYVASMAIVGRGGRFLTGAELQELIRLTRKYTRAVKTFLSDGEVWTDDDDKGFVASVDRISSPSTKPWQSSCGCDTASPFVVQTGTEALVVSPETQTTVPSSELAPAAGPVIEPLSTLEMASPASNTGLDEQAYNQIVAKIAPHLAVFCELEAESAAKDERYKLAREKNKEMVVGKQQNLDALKRAQEDVKKFTDMRDVWDTGLEESQQQLATAEGEKAQGEAGKNKALAEMTKLAAPLGITDQQTIASWRDVKDIAVSKPSAQGPAAPGAPPQGAGNSSAAFPQARPRVTLSTPAGPSSSAPAARSMGARRGPSNPSYPPSGSDSDEMAKENEKEKKRFGPVVKKEPDLELEPELEPEAEPEAEPGAEPEAEPKHEPEDASMQDGERESAEDDSAFKSEPELEPEPEPELEPEAEPEAEPKAELELEPELEPEDDSMQDGERGSAEDDSAFKLVASLQEKAEAYDLVGWVMVPRGYVSIQYESHDDIQSALEELKRGDDDSRTISASGAKEIQRWKCRLGDYSHYMSPFWLVTRLSNIWELSNQAGGGAAASHDAAIPEDQGKAIARIAEELQRLKARSAWEHITFADLCYRAWLLFQKRWPDFLTENGSEGPGSQRKKGPGRPDHNAMAQAKDEFAGADLFKNIELANADAGNLRAKRDIQAERNRISVALNYGRDLANFVENALGSPEHPDARALFLVVPFEQLVRLGRSSSMSLIPTHVRQWAFRRMTDERYLIIDGGGGRAGHMNGYTVELARLMAPYVIQGELLVRLHTEPTGRQLHLAPRAQLQSDLNALNEEYAGLCELSAWPDLLSRPDQDPLDIFGSAVDFSQGFPDVHWENTLSGETKVFAALPDLLMRVEDAATDLDAADVVKVIMASERQTDWMVVSAMDIQEGDVPLGDKVHKWLVVAKANKIGRIKRHLLCMAVLFSDDFAKAKVCIVDPMFERSADIENLCKGIIDPWVHGTTTDIEYLSGFPYQISGSRTTAQCVAQVIAHGIAITQAGRVWPGLLERESESEFSVKWRRYAKQTIMCPRLAELSPGDAMSISDNNSESLWGNDMDISSD